MKYFFAVVGICFAITIAIEKFYINDIKATYAGGELSEAFVRDGVLGNILLDAGLIGITSDSDELGQMGLCAEDEELKGFDFQNQFRLRVSTRALATTMLNIEVSTGEGDEKRSFLQKNILTKGKGHHSLVFRAEKGQDVTVKYWIKSTAEVQLLDAQIDGRYGKSQAIISRGNLVDSVLSRTEDRGSSIPGLMLSEKSPQIIQLLEQGISSSLYEGTFPGKKHKGYCRYVDWKSTRLKAKSSIADSQLLPRVTIDTEEESLRGPKGILDNKKEKGRDWERPALLSVRNRSEIVKQRVGLRYHGGGPARTKNIDSFRVVARKSFGESTVDAEAFLGSKTKVNFKNLVFKYTYLVKRGDVTEDFNPFIHALALDVGDVVNAIVPRHALIDLTVNDDHKGLYLAMEQQSERSIEHWLEDKKFTLFTYKRKNSKNSVVSLFEIVKELKTAKGDEALEILLKYFSADNVLNTIMLSAYIGDDDYCQGSELITTENGKKKITTLSWDLDHAFYKLHEGRAWIEPDKYGFRLLLPRKTECVRQRIYASTYMKSKTFRTMVSDKMEALLNSSLSPPQAIKMLDYYKKLNTSELDNRYGKQIRELEDYMNRRPAILRRQLKALENQIDSLDKENFQW